MNSTLLIDEIAICVAINSSFKSILSLRVSNTKFLEVTNDINYVKYMSKRWNLFPNTYTFEELKEQYITSRIIKKWNDSLIFDTFTINLCVISFEKVSTDIFRWNSRIISNNIPIPVISLIDYSKALVNSYKNHTINFSDFSIDNTMSRLTTMICGIRGSSIYEICNTLSSNENILLNDSYVQYLGIGLGISYMNIQNYAFEPTSINSICTGFKIGLLLNGLTDDEIVKRYSYLQYNH